MFRSSWFSHFAAIGIVLLVGVLAILFAELVVRSDSNGDKNKHNYAKDHNPSYTNHGITSLREITTNVGPVAYKAVCDNPVDAKDYDLCQQWRMAKAAEDAARYAFYQIALSFFALIGLLATVFYTAKAARAATDAATAAQVSADTARQHLHILEKPYVVMEIEEIGVTVDNGSLRFATNRFTYAFANYGRSAAIIKEICVSWPTVNKGEMPEKIDPRITRGRRAPVGVVSVFEKAYSESESLLKFIDQKLLDADAWNKYRLFFVGFVRYQDFFENSYITGFCTQFDPLSSRWVLTGGKAGYNYQRKESETD